LVTDLWTGALTLRLAQIKHTNKSANTTAQFVVHLWQSTKIVILTLLQT